jgi:hypothetical protein
MPPKKAASTDKTKKTSESVPSGFAVLLLTERATSQSLPVVLEGRS